MSFKPSQLIIAGLVGLATGIGVACATIESRSPQPSEPPVTASPAPQPVASHPVSIIPANLPSSPTPQSSSISPTPQSSSTPVSQATPSPTQQEPITIEPPNSGCKISMAVVVDPNPPLNVRSAPKVADSNVVGQLKNDTFVAVAEEQDGWLRITDPVAGWIAKNRTNSSCSLVKQAIDFVPGSHEALVKGRIIGGGSHTYLIRANQGQTLTVINHKQVFPIILTPEGKLLGTDPNVAVNKTEWTGQVPANGDYALQLDSNYKGFEYEFLVQLK
ncbi:MAG: SH3 domain-containing protein [Actinomycetota bacterium]